MGRTEPASPAMVLLRAGAAVLILHGYLVGLWPEQHGRSTVLLDAVREWLARPLGLGEDFGPLGLLLLLLASGYGAAAGYSFRPLYPLVPLATLGAFALAGAGAWSAPTGARPAAIDLLGNMTLVSHLVPGATVLLPLAWVALLALVGRAAARAMSWLPRRLHWLGYLAQLVVPLNLVALSTLSEGAQQAAAVLAFYPAVVGGQLIHAARTGTLAVPAAAGLGIAGYATIALADGLVPSFAGWWYPVAAMYAGLTATVTVVFTGETASRVAGSLPVRWAASRVWGLLLWCGVIGHPLTGWLRPYLPLTAALAVAVLGTALVTELAHRVLAVITAASRRRTREPV
ncbi:hypothetical protein [Amycolatopsis cihanbeyliensis]|uniref:hypothetical protein n=1 Tax=Amycolatopsis cihanbeyliensis TaxID=1128664 RepID=UPI001B8685D5|nr:hypothetical protein [Amycolatopsis cihanbeyliensis]